MAEIISDTGGGERDAEFRTPILDEVNRKLKKNEEEKFFSAKRKLERSPVQSRKIDGWLK